MAAPFVSLRPPPLAPFVGAALLLHAAVVAAAFLVPQRVVDLLAGGQAIAVPAGAEGLEQEVVLADAPEEAPPVPSPLPPEEAAPAIAEAAPAPVSEPPPPEPDPDFVQPETPSPAPSLAAAEPVAAALPVPAAPAPSGAEAAAPPQVVIGNDGFPKPSYPYEARARRQEGTVVLSMDVVGGAIVSATVLGSSGYPLLDRAAVQCVRARWRFPATVTASVTQPIQFALGG